MDETTTTDEELTVVIDDSGIEEDPIRAKYQTAEMLAHWCTEFDAARKERKTFNETATKTIERYCNKGGEDSPARYNLFYVNTDIKQAALYQHLPEPSIKRRFTDANDDVSRVASMLLQRVITADLDTNNFDAVFKATIFNRLVPGIGVTWVRYEEEELEPEVVEEVTVVDPATGLPVTQTNVTPAVVDQTAVIDYVSWDDFLWSPCRVWTECRWVARRIPMVKEQLTERFGSTVAPEVLATVEYTTRHDDRGPNNSVDRLYSKNQTESTCDVYEVWDKDRKLVWFIAEGAALPLDVVEDTTNFPGYYPTPLPPLGRFSTHSTLPISDYSEVSDLYVTLDKLQARAAHLIDCIKNRFVYDAEFEDLATLFKRRENEGVPVKNFSNFTEKGGMQAAIQFTPLAPYTEALSVVMSQIQNAEAQINRLEGIADFMRGETQPYDSASAIRQKGAFAPTRLGTTQKEIANYIERNLRLVVHVISRFYDDQTIIEHAGAMPATDQQYFADALKLIRADFQRNFRLKVSVDSLQDPNYQAERADRTAVVTAIGQLLMQFGPIAMQQPELKPLFVELARFAVAGLRGSESIEGIFDATLQQLQAQQQSGQEQQQPTKEQIKAQQQAQHDAMELQKAREKNQTDMAIAQAQAQSRAINDAQELEVARMNAQVNAITAQAKVLQAAHKQAIDVTARGNR